jgi:uncharacterized membrane protein YfcA
MSALALLALGVLGLAVGVLAGLVGIGGGVLIVPFLYFFYEHPEISGVQLASSLHAAVAHATSLFVIVPTAAVGTRSYARAGLVAWRVALPIAVFAILGAVIGARVALLLSTEVLKLSFGFFLLATAAHLVFRPHVDNRHAVRQNFALLLLSGLAIGMFSALLGVGGGLLAVPLLLYAVRLEIKRAAATSLAIVGIASLAGVITYMISGWREGLLPSGSFGYVHVLAGLPVLLASMIAVRWGAALNQRLRVNTLKFVLAVLFALLGMRLIWENALVLL